MKKLLGALLLICAASLSALAGDIPTSPVAPPEPPVERGVPQREMIDFLLTVFQFIR